MKLFISALTIVVLSGCATVGGAVSGAGADLQRAGEWIKNK